MTLKRFFGKGVALEQHKQPALMNPLMRIDLPETAVVPIFDFGQGHMIPIPRVGETVVKNSMLAHSKNNAAWVVAPVSGKLSCIERMEHPALGSLLCAYIRTRGDVKPIKLHGHDPNDITAQAVVQIARNACILDELDGLPLYYKLQKAIRSRCMFAVADAIDDTPYISSSLKTVSEFGEECADGLGFVLKAFDGGRAVLAAYDTGNLRDYGILDRFGFIETVRVTGGFPAWDRFEREHCPTNYLRVGVQALRALSRAVRLGEPQTETVITVSGDCVANQYNVVVPIGTPIKHILAEVGLKKAARHIIIGDTMRGIDCGDKWDYPVYPGIRGISAFSSLEKKKVSPCVSCGKCTEICPKLLLPSRLVPLAENGMTGRAAVYASEKCDGCGACSAVCPCGIDVADIMLSLSDRAGASE